MTDGACPFVFYRPGQFRPVDTTSFFDDCAIVPRYTAGDPPVVSVDVYSKQEFIPNTDPFVRQTVSVGDVVKFRKSRHRVVNIVPPDAKRQVVGWVELKIDPEPPQDDKDDDNARRSSRSLPGSCPVRRCRQELEALSDSPCACAVVRGGRCSCSVYPGRRCAAWTAMSTTTATWKFCQRCCSNPHGENISITTDQLSENISRVDEGDTP